MEWVLSIYQSTFPGPTSSSIPTTCSKTSWLLSFSWTGTPKILKLTCPSIVWALPHRYESLGPLASAMLLVAEACTSQNLSLHLFFSLFFFVEYCLKIFNKYRTYIKDNWFDDFWLGFKLLVNIFLQFIKILPHSSCYHSKETSLIN